MNHHTRVAILLVGVCLISSVSACSKQNKGGTERSGSVAKTVQQPAELEPIELPVAWEFDYKSEVKEDAEFCEVTEDGRYLLGWFSEPNYYADNRKDFLWRYSIVDKKLDKLDLSRLGVYVRGEWDHPQVRIHPSGNYALIYSGRYKLSQVEFAEKKLSWTCGIGGYVSDALWSEKHQLWIVADMNGDITAVDLAGSVKYHKRWDWRFDRLRWGAAENAALAIPFRCSGPYTFSTELAQVTRHDIPLSYYMGERTIATRDNKTFMLGGFIYQACGSAAVLYTVGEGGQLERVVAWETSEQPIVGLAPGGFAILGSFLFVSPYCAESVAGDELVDWIYKTATDQWKPRRLTYPFDFEYEHVPTSYELRVVDTKGNTKWFQDLKLPNPDGPLFGPGAWDLESLDDSRYDAVTAPFLVDSRWVQERNAYVQTYYEIGEEGLSDPVVSLWLEARQSAYDGEEPPFPPLPYQYVDSGNLRVLHRDFRDEGKLVAYRMPEQLVARRARRE
jgi:hypothetical protein